MTVLSTKIEPEIKKGSIWTRPTFTPEHGVLLVLCGSFLTGAALAQKWTYLTTIALLCAFFALLTEYPYIVQIKLRKKPRPRYLLWGGIYGTISLSLAIFLWFKSPLLIYIYILAIVSLIADGIFVYKGKHKSIVNETIGFTGICLAAPLAYGATTGTVSLSIMAIWLLDSLFFCSTIYTMKLRRKKTKEFTPGIIYHCLASVIVASLYSLNYLSLVTALCFAIALVKLGAVFVFQQWYRKARIHYIVLFETRFALLFIAIASVSLLPAHLPPH